MDKDGAEIDDPRKVCPYCESDTELTEAGVIAEKESAERSARWAKETDEEDEELIEFSETPELDPKSDDVYSIEHYDDNGTNYHYTSYTSYTGIILHQLIDEDDYYCGGFYIYNKEFTDKIQDLYQKVKA